MSGGKFVEIAAVNISSKRTIVLSKSNENIIIGQKLSVKDDNDKPINFFLKGALNIPVDSIYDFRDAINDVIKHIEKND
jgi:hypothetical protein